MTIFRRSFNNDHTTAVALFACCMVGFLLLAWLIVTSGSDGFDQSVIAMLRERGDLGDPLGPAWIEEAARDITALGSTPLLFATAIGVTLYWALKRQPVLRLFPIACISAAQALSEILKALFSRSRPYLVSHEVTFQGASFPSGHTLMATAAFFTLGLILARRDPSSNVYWLTLAALVSALVGLSRVYLGVHWPTDVVAGWCAGLAVAIVSAGVHRAIVGTPT